MITLGIDLSSSPEETAASVMEWEKSRLVVHRPELKCNDAQLDSLIDHADVVGIDEPFGWPNTIARDLSTTGDPNLTIP